MAVSDIRTESRHSRDGTHPADVARGNGQSDPFPPEGTDEKILSDVKTGEDAISEADGLKATKAALQYEAVHDSHPASTLDILSTFVTSFLTGFFRRTPTRTCLRADRTLRNNLDESQIDSMIDDSFPASDPPSSY
ncbi:MAG: hypothetical protein QM647_03160 [Asticcacaulis sp.]|uniref:hypothetical protein n=1 Tax=Asticcacaulis sp. TaxID=1872648 RepID=UPI0039E3F679